MNEQDYDNDGNNIVPCPICLDIYCKSKDGGKCPREDEFIKSFEMHPHTKQQLESLDRLSNILGLHSDKCNGHLHGRDCKALQIKRLFKQALKSQAEYIRAKMVPKLEKVKSSDIRDGFNACADELIYNLDELINSF